MCAHVAANSTAPSRHKGWRSEVRQRYFAWRSTHHVVQDVILVTKMLYGTTYMRGQQVAARWPRSRFMARKHCSFLSPLDRPCSDKCKRPLLLIHVKFLCLQLLDRFPRHHHVFDPVDLKEGDLLRLNLTRFSGVLALNAQHRHWLLAHGARRVWIVGSHHLAAQSCAKYPNSSILALRRRLPIVRQYESCAINARPLRLLMVSSTPQLKSFKSAANIWARGWCAADGARVELIW
jgi:hypothetical protein